MGFYNIPIVVAFMLAILTACFQNRSLSFDRKLELMGQGIGDKNIITMLLIFLTAGTFVGVVGRSSAESVAYLMLSLIPARFSVAVLFVVACFVSTSMGTSVGTITLIVPIPLGRKKRRSRGFNQAEILAGELSGKLLIPLDADHLVRWRDTRPQKSLDPAARRENVRGIFQWTGRSLAGAEGPPYR